MLVFAKYSIFAVSKNVSFTFAKMLTLQSFTFNPFSENTYILYGAQGKAFLIDPGCAIHSEQVKLRDFIKEKGLTVEKILLTHAHIDHVFGLQWACDTFALPVHLHPNEQEVLECNPLDARLFGFDFPEFDGDYVFVDEHTILHTRTFARECSLLYRKPTQDYLRRCAFSPKHRPYRPLQGGL